MTSPSRTYQQGLASAKSGKGAFSQIAKPERMEFFHRSIVLARIFATQSDKWVLKGGTALVWRDASARSTRDIDIFNRTAVDIVQAVQEFEQALNEISTPPDDISFECEILSDGPVKAGNRQSIKIRIHLIDSSAHRLGHPISIDLVTGCKITGEIEEYPASALEDALNEPMPKILLYPVVDHLADKVAATMQTYSQLGAENPSTRVRDLVDIVQIALTEVIDGAQLHKALESERLERNLAPYSQGLICPDTWETSYRGRKLKKGKAPTTYSEALSIAQSLINPAITGESKGKTWRANTWH